MLFLRTRFFIAFMVLITALVLGGGGMGYVSLMANGDKTGAERLLMYCLVAGGVMIVFCVRILAYGRRAARKFDKILDALKLKGQLPLERLDYFGAFGANMRRLYEELHALGERKSSRIQQQNLTINKLLEFVNVPLLVVDATGEVRKVSGGFSEKHKITPVQAAGTQLRGYVEDLDFQAILQQANRTKSPAEVKSGKIPLTFYPVLTENNDVSYFVVVFGPHELKGFVTETADRKASQPGRERKHFIGGLVDVIKKRMKPEK